MQKEKWRREVQKALIDRHYTMTKLCEELGCSRSWIYNVLCGEAPEEAQKEWEKKINEKLKIKGEGEEK